MFLWLYILGSQFHMVCICQFYAEKKIHIQSSARIVWHIAPRDRWCHLHPRVRIVPARFGDNDLFKWEKGEKIHKPSSLSKYGTFTAVENDENEALLRTVFPHRNIGLREKTWEKNLSSLQLHSAISFLPPSFFSKNVFVPQVLGLYRNYQSPGLSSLLVLP